ncbi:protein NO VEIN domain-containing protein [Mycobacterium syngnathidarum]
MAGLLEHGDNRIRPTARLRVLASLSDDDAVAFLRRILVQQSNYAQAVETGLLGELEVVRRCREDLKKLGRFDLSDSVQQVSVLDDSLGYDVLAPMIGGRTRHLEVKTAQSEPAATFDFFLSRNEFDTGRRDLDWALVACRRVSQVDVELVGWCRAQSLYPYVPEDRSGRWTEAQLHIPTSVLFDDMPPPI